MRLDGSNGDNDWQCFDVERSAVVPRVVWIDEESATWGEYDLSPAGCAHAAFTGWLPEIHHQEKRIQICHKQRIVLFNPLDDEGGVTETVTGIITRETVTKAVREVAGSAA